MKEVEGFFRKQFKGYDVEDEEKMRNYSEVLDQKLGRYEQVWLGREVQDAEIKDALAGMAKNKTPGSDG